MGLEEGAEDGTVATNASPQQPDGLSENGSIQPSTHHKANGSLKPEVRQSQLQPILIIGRYSLTVMM